MQNNEENGTLAAVFGKGYDIQKVIRALQEEDEPKCVCICGVNYSWADMLLVGFTLDELEEM